MSEEKKGGIAPVEDILIENALKRAMRKAAIMHKKMGNTVYASKNGVVYAIAPEDIVIPDAPPEDPV
jgi:hypothetical protein